MSITSEKQAGKQATAESLPKTSAGPRSGGSRGKVANIDECRIKLPERSRRADSGLFSTIVRAEPLVGLEAVRAIRAGYSALILKAASSYFDVPDARIQSIAQVPASTASRLQKKQARIDPAASERVYRMGSVTRMAIEVFENEAAAIDWMRQPNRALASAAPLELMDTEPGAVSVRQVLNAIATGGAA